MQRFTAAKHLGAPIQETTNNKGKETNKKKTFKKKKKSWSSRVNEGHCDVTGAVGGGEAFVEVSQSPRVHEAPAFPG